MTDKVRRRLTTLLCADAAGYTRLMGADEAGTLATLRRRRAAMATLIERHEGRIVNTWGDAVIAEFASVVEAVQCAVETQQELSSHNDELPEAQRMNFRIGINLGDVMLEGDDVYGDGVNIAARLQELAEPGGILISGPGLRPGAQQTVDRLRAPRRTKPEERRPSGDRLPRRSRAARRRGPGAAARADGEAPGGSRKRRSPDWLASGAGTQGCLAPAPC